MSNTSVRGEDVNKDKYALPRNEMELERLETQHSFITEALKGRLIVDNSVQLGAGARILDSGTGSASWLLALSKEVPETVELVGTDISSTMFPNEVPKNVKLYDMPTTNLPTEWDNSFDFINQRLLVAALTVPQWHAALSELKRILKPGGSIQLIEVGRYRCLHGTTSMLAMDKVSEMSNAIFNKLGVLGSDCQDQLPGMVEEAGFCDVQLELCPLPLGKQWGESGTTGSKLWEALYRSFGASLLAMGGLGVCSSQAEVDELVDRAKEEWDENAGIYREMYAITARKAI